MASSSARKENNTQPTFQWSPEMIEYLIVYLKDYKTEMDYKNVDFNSDVVALNYRLRQNKLGPSAALGQRRRYNPG